MLWDDPDGGRIVLHGVLPTTVYPQSLRPRIEWHALALLEGPEIEDVWQLEEASEKESAGINLASALLGGGLDSALIEDLIQLDEIQTGRFPDPEPRRLHRLALRHQRPVYCIEPTLDDQAWEEQRTQEAKVSTHWRKLLSMVRIGKKWRKAVKQRIFDAVPPPKNVPKDMATASVLSAAWWDLMESRINASLSKARDERFAQRLRGARSRPPLLCFRREETERIPDHGARALIKQHIAIVLMGKYLRVVLIGYHQVLAGIVDALTKSKVDF